VDSKAGTKRRSVEKEEEKVKNERTLLISVSVVHLFIHFIGVESN